MVIHYQTVKRSKRVRQIDGRAFVGSKIRRVSGDDVAALPSLRVFQSDEKTVNGVNHLIGVNDLVEIDGSTTGQSFEFDKCKAEQPIGRKARAAYPAPFNAFGNVTTTCTPPQAISGIRAI